MKISLQLVTGTAPFDQRSLPELRSSATVPGNTAGLWRKLRAYSGPTLLVSVGYMDPGNWGTDLQAGAQFKYGLLSCRP